MDDYGDAEDDNGYKEDGYTRFEVEVFDFAGNVDDSETHSIVSSNMPTLGEEVMISTLPAKDKALR